MCRGPWQSDMLKELQVATVQDGCGSSFEVRLRQREKKQAGRMERTGNIDALDNI